jgi:hypothetical protein
LRCEIIFYILVLAIQTTTIFASSIRLGRMTVPAVSSFFDADNMIFIMLVH